MDQTTLASVLVVGAGPVGLTAACALLRHGISCRIVDINTEPSRWSKAALVHARTLELLDDLGIADEAVRRGRKVYGLRLYSEGRQLAHITLDGMDTPYPYLLGLSQHETEDILTQKLESLGGRVERGVRLVQLRHNDEGVTAQLHHGDGREEELEVPWLVACDGGYSMTRHLLEVPFEGKTYDEVFLQADLRIRWPMEFPPDEIVAFFSPRGVLAAMPVIEEGRYRLLAPMPATSDIEPCLESFQALVAERGPMGTEVFDPGWMVTFPVQKRLVPSFRKGRVFFAGDAAHLQSPASGQGMNLGMQDAYNLAWKLALVINGEGQPVLLDSYDAERRPTAQACQEAADFVAGGVTSLLTLRNPVAKELRDPILRFIANLDGFRERLSTGAGMLNIHYAHSPIVAEDRGSVLGSYDDGMGGEGRISLKAWSDFTSGVAVGDHARDQELAVPLPGDPARTRLFEVLRGTKHVLLLFGGLGGANTAASKLRHVATHTRLCYGSTIVPYVVLRHVSEDGGEEAQLLRDPDGALHRRYGAYGECLYLIRPDGYVAYRSQPADLDLLFVYLKRIFV